MNPFLSSTLVTPKRHRSLCLQLTPVGAAQSPLSTASPKSRVMRENLTSPQTPNSARSSRTKRAGDFPANMSPLKSPRRLNILLSPRKVAIPGCFDALSPRKHLAPRASPLTDSLRRSRAGLQGIKRKLCDVSPQEQPTKIKRICDNHISPSCQKTPVGSDLLMSRENLTTGAACMKKLTFTDNFKTPEKSARINVQSPTVDLPNYVFNPQPRTPQALERSMKENDQTKNWLKRLQLKREGDRESMEGPTSESPKGKIPRKVTDTPSPATVKQSRPSSAKKTASPRTSRGAKVRTSNSIGAEFLLCCSTMRRACAGLSFCSLPFILFTDLK